MTAFARAEKTDRLLTVLVEMRSYNSRHLDLVIRMPNEYAGFEEKIKAVISSKVSRGRIEAMLKIRDDNESAVNFEVNETTARAYYNALMRLKDIFGLESKPTLENMASISGVIRPCQIDVDMDACWPVIRDCINAALADLDRMRRKEGEHISMDLLKRLDFIQQSAADIKERSSDLCAHYQQRLNDRIVALTNGLVEIDPGRIAQEAAFLADKSDIAEELVRADSHIRQFRSIIASPEPSGRKLNFLLQEFIREFNTMGAKAASDQISHTIVEVKSELEKIREQVQNVE